MGKHGRIDVFHDVDKWRGLVNAGNKPSGSITDGVFLD
jgi:hypothetical protein